MNDINERIQELQEKDQQLNAQYRDELKKTLEMDDITELIAEYQKKMAIKTRWYRREMWKIMNNEKPAN